MEYDNTNQGVLYRNRRKEKDSHPTHTGRATVFGGEFWLAAWPHRDDGKNLSVAMTNKADRGETYDFVLHYKGVNGTKPHYTGELNGEKIACWINEMKRDTEKLRKGDKYLSLRFTTPNQGGGGQGQEEAVVNDDIPF